MPKRKVRILNIIKIVWGGYQLLMHCKRLWRHPSETLLNYKSVYSGYMSLGILAYFLDIMYIFCVLEWIFSCSDSAFKTRFHATAAVLWGVRSLFSVSMQLKHKQQPCFAALVHLRRRPSENKRFTYRHSATKPPQSVTRKYISAFPLHFDRKNKHSPSRFDKIIYFLSLFIVPNGCHDVALPPGGAREPTQVPPPSHRLPRQLSNLSFMHWMRERDGGVKGKSRAWALKICPQRPTWLSSHSPFLKSHITLIFLGCNPLKLSVFEIK